MFCRFCGKEILEDSDFCSYCGKQLGSETILNKEQDAMINNPKMYELDFSDSYYKKQAAKIASETLVKVTKFSCYIALAVFLFFNIKMAPSYGTAKLLFYALSAAISIALIVLFNKKVLPERSKKLYSTFLFFSILVITASIGLRIVYESKVDYVTSQIPSSGTITVSLITKTEYYNSTGTGTIRNPSTNIRIGDKWYDNGDKITVTLGKQYSLRVGSGGSGSGGYTDGSITFNASSFAGSQYTITKQVNINSGPASLAEVKLTFERYCTFWEVVFY